ncbi:hypothetical protein BAE44_0009305 [Dichanthelium oligosanthes]|uniref:F-box domain-containing protein n=1 Tax=Dichanthelium oligosanthes TaxID=888268 RepID=A0A1E5VX58_9POAL|nr:hypothetical protein BAE44_0009305 [Dichanthelium oligosanthes]
MKKSPGGMDEDMWASPPTDLLVEIFCRLEASDVVHCACACKPWRRAIIGNAWSLLPRPDAFNPNLLLGFFYQYWHIGRVIDVRLPGLFESALAVPPPAGCETSLLSYRPAPPPPASTCRHSTGCCRRAMASSCSRACMWIISACATPCLGTARSSPTRRRSWLWLVSSYDLSPSDELGVRIVAVQAEEIDDGHSLLALGYQIFSRTSNTGEAGAWGRSS